MAYKPRNIIIGDNDYFHAMWQCHNNDWLIRADWAKRLYYDLLIKYKDEYGVTFFAYHFMENHIHLVGKIGGLEEFSNFFRLVHNLFSKNLNRRMLKKGQVIMDRFLSPRIESEQHLLAVMIYTDLNGVRAGRDKHPRESKWSSYKHYAIGKSDSLIETVSTYKDLGADAVERQNNYIRMVEGQMMFYSCSV